MFDKLFKKEKYLDCHNIKHSIHFFYDNIRACCSNVPGPVFYENYDGRDIDWDYVYKKRKDWIKQINSFRNKKFYPDECANCFELPSMYSSSKIDDFPNLIKKVFIQNNMSCNAKCLYCSFGHINNSFKYRVLPVVNSMISNQILSKNARVYMSGGEITISPEFEKMFSTLTGYLDAKVEILTSGIKYSESIKEAFVNDKCILVISLDSSKKETYKKIKQVDCFDSVVNNVKSYISASDYARNNITLKYILVDGINDNKGEISDFVHLVNDLGIKNIRMDVDFVKYKYSETLNIPEYYFDLYEHFNSLAESLNLNIQTNDQAKAIIAKKKNSK